MNIILFLLFSSVEWLGLVLLTFAMFKFPFKGYWGQIILTAVIMALLSHFVFEVLELRVVATLLQPPIIFLFLWQMFRIHIFYAGLMTVYGYMGYVFIQYSILLLMLSFGVQLENLIPNTFPTYVLQFASIFTVLLVVWLFRKFRIGYSFVPDSEHVSVTMNGVNLWLLLLTIAGYGFMALTNFVTFSKGIPTLFIMIAFIVLGVLLYYALRKEYSDD
ncbi:hypothetical protein AB6A23_21545 [Paenibacillus tarimensis]